MTDLTAKVAADLSSEALAKEERLRKAADILWSEIASIEYVGYEQVYDIEVEGIHNFVANGILAHNTYLSGNVGIGTTGPGYKLDVNGIIRSNGVGAASSVILQRDNNASQAYIDWTPAGALSASNVAWRTGLSANSNSYSVFYHNGAVDVFPMVITNSGNVGIGTTGPDTPLEIYHVPAVNNTFDDILKITSKYPTAAADGFGPAIVFSGSINDAQERLLGRIATAKEGTSNTAGMTFSTQTTADTVTEKMRILANGNVGIGTTNPGSYKLNVNGTIYADTVTIGGSTSAVITSYDVARILVGGVYIGGNGVEANNFLMASYQKFYTSGGGWQNWGIVNATTNKIDLAAIGTINSGAITSTGNSSFAGNVGIGTTGPLSKLDVQGNLNISGGLSTNFSNFSPHLLYKRTNQMINSTYEGSSFSGWGNQTPSYLTESITSPSNVGFSGTVLRWDVSGGGQSQRDWASGGAHSTDFVLNHTYRISFKYRSNGPFNIHDRDSIIVTIPANSGNAKFFTYDYTKTSDAWTVPRLLVYFGNSATVSWVEMDDFSVEDISSPSYAVAAYADNTGNVGIGTTGPLRRLDLSTAAGGMTFGDDVTVSNERGIFWHSGAGATGYGIFRPSGAWSNPYVPLNIVWQTGIVLDPGASASPGSYVQIPRGGLNIGTAASPPSNGLSVSGNVGIGTTGPSALLSVGSTEAFKVTSAGAVTAASYNGRNLTTSLPQSCYIQLAPEFPTSALRPDGTSNNGILTASFDATNFHNYYNWTGNAAAQDYDIAVRVLIPEDFGTWDATSAISFYNVVDATPGTTGLTITVYGTNNVQAYTSPATIQNTTWTATNLTAVNISGTYTPGSYMTIVFKMIGDSGKNVKLGDVTLKYNRAGI